MMVTRTRTVAPNQTTTLSARSSENPTNKPARSSGHVAKSTIVSTVPKSVGRCAEISRSPASAGAGAPITNQTPPDAIAQMVWATCEHGDDSNFFGWHRIYLYYFERVLRWAANDDTLRLAGAPFDAHPGTILVQEWNGNSQRVTSSRMAYARAWSKPDLQAASTVGSGRGDRVGSGLSEIQCTLPLAAST